MKFRSKVERYKKNGLAKILFGIVGIIIAIVSYNTQQTENKLPNYMTDSYSPKIDSILNFLGNSAMYQNQLAAAKRDSDFDVYYANILRNKSISAINTQKLEELFELTLSDNSRFDFLYFTIFTYSLNGKESEYSTLSKGYAVTYLEQRPKKLAEFLTNGYYTKGEFDTWALILSKSLSGSNNLAIIDKLESNTLKLMRNESVEFKNTISTLFSEIKKTNE